MTRAGAACFAYGDLQALEQRARVLEQRLAGGRQLDRPPRAVEQRVAKLALQILQLLAERWLGDAQTLGGAAKVSFFGDRGEVTQMSQLHRASSRQRRVAQRHEQSIQTLEQSYL